MRRIEKKRRKEQRKIGGLDLKRRSLGIEAHRREKSSQPGKLNLRLCFSI